MKKSKGIPSDYDINPERFRANVRAVEQYGLSRDVHEDVADHVMVERLEPTLDIGCGEGRLTQPLHDRGIATVAFDYSATMLAAVPDPRVQGDANHLPFADATFGSIAALYMLYHLDNPSQALAECYRVLRPGGLLAACVPSRYNDPELAPILPSSPPETFDAENGPALVAEFFQNVEIERWNAPLIYLPDKAALHHYLLGRNLCQQVIDQAMTQVEVPLYLTKRGALIYGRKE